MTGVQTCALPIFMLAFPPLESQSILLGTGRHPIQSCPGQLGCGPGYGGEGASAREGGGQGSGLCPGTTARSLGSTHAPPGGRARSQQRAELRSTAKGGPRAETPTPPLYRPLRPLSPPGTRSPGLLTQHAGPGQGPGALAHLPSSPRLQRLQHAGVWSLQGPAYPFKEPNFARTVPKRQTLPGGPASSSRTPHASPGGRRGLRWAGRHRSRGLSSRGAGRPHWLIPRPGGRPAPSPLL